MIKLAIPLVHVSDSAAAQDFYCNRLGFRREFAYRVDDSKWSVAARVLIFR